MKQLPSLNGIRAISVVLVVFSHLVYGGNLSVYQFDQGWINLIFRTFYDGQLGVNIFFVVSGFIITKVLLHEYESSGKISIKNFYIRRTLRIFPAYYFLLTVYFVLQIFDHIHIQSESWLTALTYTKYFNRELDLLTGHGWTLSVEEHFYLIWPMVFTQGEKTQKRFAWIVVFLVPLIRLYDHAFPISFIDNYTIFYRFDAIAIGCLAALYEDKLIQNLKPYWQYLFPLCVFSLFTIKLFFLLSKKIGLDFLFIPFGTTSGSIANVSIVILMMYSLYGPKLIWYKFLNARIMIKIGLYSYSIYLWQQLFLMSEMDSWINQFPQNVFLLIGASLFSYYLIELPFLRYKSRFK